MEKKNKVERELGKSKELFYIRAISFFLLGITPAIYLFIKFRCYEFTSKLALGGWGVLALVLFFGAIYIFLRYLIFGGKWAYWKQCIKVGMCIALPLLLLILICKVAQNYFNELLVVGVVALISWVGAGLINPFPEWTYNKTLGETADVVSYAIKRVKEE